MFCWVTALAASPFTDVDLTANVHQPEVPIDMESGAWLSPGTDAANEVSIPHTGDFHERYLVLVNFRGKIDVLIHPKLWLDEGLAPRLLEI